MSATLLVKFEQIEGRISGEILERGPEAQNVPGKIVFIERSTQRGVSPNSGNDVWICDFIRDSKPGERKGVIFVQLREPARWELAPVGEPVLGVSEQTVRCVNWSSWHYSAVRAKKDIQ